MSQVIINAYCPKCEAHIDLDGIKMNCPDKFTDYCDECGAILEFEFNVEVSEG